MNPHIHNEFTQVFSRIPFNHTLGLKLTQLDATQIAMSFSMKPELIGNFMHEILHGGVISSVLDMAGGVAVMADLLFQHQESSLEELANLLGKCSTVNLQVDFLRPGKGTHFIAKAWVIKSGNKISFTQMTLHNQEEVLIASAHGTYLF